MANNPKTETKPPRLWTPVFVAIVLMALCCFIVGQGLNAGTSVYLAFRGANATLAGIGAAAFSAAAAVSRIVCGPMADLRGRIAVITVGAIVLIAGTICAAAVPDLNLFVVWRLIQGAGFAAVTTASATAAADVLPAERLGEGIGYYGLGQAIAMSVGPALALFLVASEPPENLFWGLSASAVAVLVISFFCHYERNLDRLPESSTYRRLALARERTETQDEENGSEKPARGLLFNSIFEPKALTGALPMMVICPTFGFGIFFVGLYGTTIGIPSAGLFYTVSAFAMIAVRLSSRSFMDRTPAIKLHAFSALVGILFCAILICVGQIGEESPLRNILFYAAGVPYGLALGMALPVNQAVSVKNSPTERWGAANGLFLLMNDIGIGGAAIVWGITNDLFGFTTTLVFVAALIAASVGVAWLTYPASEKRWRSERR